MSILFLSFLFAIIFSVLAVAIVIYRYRSWIRKQWKKLFAIGTAIIISTAGVVIFYPLPTGGGDAWLGVNANMWAGDCGHTAILTLQSALNGTNYWGHTANEVHWFILDLGQTYTIKQLRGRSQKTSDPTDVNVYISDINGTWGSPVATNISTWCNTSSWATIDSTDANGRYIYVVIVKTENPLGINWGNNTVQTIFDVYGSVYTGGNSAPTLSGESPTNNSVNKPVNPNLYVICSDSDAGDTLNATWWSNSSGDWVQFASNETSFSSGTNITQPTSNFSMTNTKYWWSVNLSDGMNNWDNETYCFTTSSSTNPPSVYVIEPLNGSTNIYWQPMISIWANDTEGNILTVNWYENSTGDWVLVQTNTSVTANSTVEFWYENASTDNTTYWWNATINDGTYNFESWNNFTIKSTAGGSIESDETDEDRGRNGYGWFGWQVQGTSGVMIANLGSSYAHAGNFTMNNTNAVADYIMVYIYTTANYNGQVKCLLFNGNTKVYVGETDCLTINYPGTVLGWYKFNFSGTKPSLTANTPYFITVWGKRSTVTGSVYAMYSTTNPGQRWRETKSWLSSQNCPLYSGNYLGTLLSSSSTNSIYCAYTTSDTSIPNITINYAGNNSDYGGPYYRPPETQFGGTITTDGYYTNDSYQSENWMLINATVESTTGGDVYPKVNIKRDNIWYNGTSMTNKTGKYWEYNLTANATNQKISFDIQSNDSKGGQRTLQWNKSGVKGTVTDIFYTRRYVTLNCTNPVNISYQPFYLLKNTTETGPNPVYDTYDMGKRDVLHHDQGPDNTVNDTGYMDNITLSDYMNNVYCGLFNGWWYDKSACIQPINLTNIYYHVWWTNNLTALYGFWNKYKSALAPGGNNQITFTQATSVSNITYQNSVSWLSKNYHLSTVLSTVSVSNNFTDNSIYELSIHFERDTTNNPSVICNRSVQSFVLFNVPSNEILNTTYGDTDGDGLSDYKELYVNYTNPFIADTDNDGVDDYDETLSGSDPNNYTDTIPYTLPSGGFLEYNSTIRKQGTDYFVWLGGNTSAYNVSVHVPGLDEREEYIGVQGNDTWSNTNASWIHYHYFDKSGTNFTVTTFDVIEVYLNDVAGSVVVNMHENDYMNYTNTKNYTWVNNTKNKGYNYTGYNREADTTLSAINTSVTLQSGEYIALWNKTSYTWVIYNAGIGITDDNVEQWDVILSKVEDKTPPYEVWNT